MTIYIFLCTSWLRICCCIPNFFFEKKCCFYQIIMNYICLLIFLYVLLKKHLIWFKCWMNLLVYVTWNIITINAWEPTFIHLFCFLEGMQMRRTRTRQRPVGDAIFYYFLHKQLSSFQLPLFIIIFFWITVVFPLCFALIHNCMHVHLHDSLISENQIRYFLSTIYIFFICIGVVYYIFYIGVGYYDSNLEWRY